MLQTLRLWIVNYFPLSLTPLCYSCQGSAYIWWDISDIACSVVRLTLSFSFSQNVKLQVCRIFWKQARQNRILLSEKYVSSKNNSLKHKTRTPFMHAFAQNFKAVVRNGTHWKYFSWNKSPIKFILFNMRQGNISRPSYVDADWRFHLHIKAIIFIWW